jgi:hypothetical protein
VEESLDGQTRIQQFDHLFYGETSLFASESQFTNSGY